MKRILPLFALIGFAVSAAFAATPWFDADIAGLADWPTDGSDKTVTGVGVWSNTEAATLDVEAHVLDVFAEAESELQFTPLSPREFTNGMVSVCSTLTFVPGESVPSVEPDMKAALVIVEPEGGTGCFYAVAKDPDGVTNVWVALDVPAEGVAVAIEVSLKSADERQYVRYVVDGAALTSNGESWLEIVVESAEVERASLRGRTRLVALSGEAETVATMATFTIPALTNLSVVSVTAAGAAVTPSNGVYEVESGTLVTVAFEPDEGYMLSAQSMTFAVRGEMEMPVEGRPRAIPVGEIVRINEIGASNGTTIRTANGGLELDWVELRNDADFAVDLTGWYLFDDPSEKQSKWEKIRGDGRIPAKGYKIVWCDKKYADFAPSEAYSKIGLSTSGEPLFLATPGGTVADIIENFGRQIKDISFGRGHLARTVLPASAEAEYRLGGVGEWTPIFGPVGMSAEAAGFKAVSYKMVSGKTISNMDKAEEYLRDETTWASVSTNEGISVIAFREGSSNGNFSGYDDYPGVSGDQFIVVVSGAVMVPRSGLWTFAVGSDDGFSARISRLGDSWSWENRGTRGYAQSTATFNLEAGVYDVDITYFEYNGGAVFDFSVAEGDATPFDQHSSQFHLVGSAESGVLHAGALGAQVAADLSEAMPGVTDSVEWRGTFAMAALPDANDTMRLRIRYADGFTARLNGVEFANVAATNSRPAMEALEYAYFEIPANLIVAGENVLEVTGFNDDIDDTEFFLSPEVIWEIDEDQFVYFPTPTPGAHNLAGGRTGFTPAVAASEPRGWKTQPFDLALSCPDNPGAAIYYTLDGSSPVAGAANTFRYVEPINIASTTVVRAAVPDADSILQADTALTYLFLDDILSQPKGVVPAGFPATGTVNGQKMVYGMVTNAIAEKGETGTETLDRLLRGFTNSIPAISITTESGNLFDKTRGIYVNATGNGRGWERPVMVEQIDPVNGTANEFSFPAGLRIRGAYSRGSGIPKHSFRLFFRSEYGKGKLEHKMFGDEGAEEFDKIDLRTEQNYAWSNNGGWETFVHEVFSRDSERDMGSTYNRSRYLHLFINGVYWGLYQTEERVDDYYAESYNGGSAANYDVIRTSQPGYNTGVAEGEAEAYTEFWRITTQEGYGADHPDNYNRVRGLSPDGTRNPALPVYLDVTNLIVHVMTAHFVADSDSPVSVGSSGMANNIIAFRDRIDGDSNSDGFKWNRHDAEHSLSRGNGANATLMASTNILLYGTRALYSKNLVIGNFNPYEIHYELCANPEYRTVFADQVYKHVLREGGALTTTNAVLRFRARMAEIDDAIVCEAARWGHVPSQRRRSDWLKSCQDCLNFIEERVPILISCYRQLGWYPSIDAPAVTNAAGERLLGGETVGTGARVFATGGEDGTVWYTTDGSDPRLEGGAVNATAAEFPLGEGLPVPSDGLSLKLRVRTAGGEWSAIETLSLEGEPVDYAALSDALRIVAVNSSTADSKGDGSEFIVLTNIVADALIDLTGVRLVAWNAAKKSEAEPSLTISFGAGSIGAGEALTLDKATYFGSKGKLTNSGVGIRIYDATNGLVQDVRVDAGWWGSACDETGEWFLAKEFGNVVTNRWQWKPTATALPDALRVAAVYSSTAGDGGDTGEFVVLTNLSASAKIDLADLRLVAWNAKKKSEADPSLVIDFTNELEVAAGGAVTLDQETWFGTGKLTNSKVGLRLYDAAGALAQDVIVDADWWSKACDGTGAHFVGTNLVSEAKASTDWMPSFPLVVSSAARSAITAAVVADARIKPWLDSLGTTADGAAAIAAFDGGEEALSLCYLVDTPPEADPEVELEIPSISFDAEGNVVIGGVLTQHGVEQSKRVNGAIRLYHATTLGGLPAASDPVELGHVFPVTPAALDLPDAPTRFFRLKLE